MRILELLPNLASGGAERFVTDISNEMVLKDNEVFVLTFRAGNGLNFYKNELSTNINLIEYHGGWSFCSKIYQFFVVLNYVYKIKPDVVHCHTLGFTYALFVSFFLPKKKYYYTVHNLAENDTSLGLGAMIRRKFLKNRIRPITISRQCAESFRNFYDYNPYGMIENGCRHLHCSCMLKSVKDEIEAYKMNNNTKVFINVARISKQKNHILLINAFKQFSKLHKNAILIIIGRKSDAWNDIEQSLNESGNIFYLGEKHNVADYLYCSDFFCLSSLWEGLPISLLEAGMLGVYPICTPVGGVTDVICNTNFGILSKDVTICSYEEALEVAVESNLSKTDLIKMYSERYGIEKCAVKYLNIFKA